ncbi:MAG: hypothetical protein J2P47_01270 [Acetobacteraceae bacterium]|nr:hypothetical protein [Acetobacteraceae bacterium]
MILWRLINRPATNRPLTLARRSFLAGNAATLALMDSPRAAALPPQQVQEILAAHNSYRAAVGVPALRWSDSLAAGAQQWADYLASTGQLQHSDSRRRHPAGSTPGIGENLAAVRNGFYTVAQLVHMWGFEKRYFIGGIFPNVSSTGNWEDVGHYTQIVWRNTAQVGCGVATGNRIIVMVGRYSPPGNVDGERVF